MATLRELKGRIGSVKSSEKITGAMKMISSAKMHKADGVLRSLVPYRHQIKTIIAHLLNSDNNYDSPLITPREVNHISIVVFGSDDGLCGAYNIQIFKYLITKLAEYKTIYGNNVRFRILPIGKKMVKAVSKLAQSDIEVVGNIQLNTRSQLEEIKVFTNQLQNEFISLETDKIAVIYTHFKSVSKQFPVIDELFPIDPAKLSGELDHNNTNKPYLFEPDPNTIFNSVLPLFVLSTMQEIAAENNASEQAARVMAMQSANDNAKNLLEELQIVYNKLRQQSITTELLDILGGQVKE
ncbi:MAG: ATP synthase F1 subunit gamma [Muribaculaceae bacterium]|nr:ATP synthase F1 subunit gamma [Muribaculaceae bacterium]